jgi:AcrR family transcriptional regulator
MLPKKKRRPGRPRGSSSDATRASILRAARVCFAQRGFRLATNRDIAERAGLTAAAIYQYFESKVVLYTTTALEAIAEVAQHMRVLAQDDKDVPSGLSRLVLGLLSVHERDPSLAPFLSAMPTELHRHPELARVLKSTPNDMPVITLSVVQPGVKRGELGSGDSARVVAMFIACLMGLTQFSVLFGDELGSPAARTFAELLEGRLFAPSTQHAKQPTKQTTKTPTKKRAK